MRTGHLTGRGSMSASCCGSATEGGNTVEMNRREFTLASLLAAGVPMVHFNRPPAESDAYSVAIQADNRKIMQNTVQFLVDEAKRLGGKYKACILIGNLGDVNAIQRRDGFFDIVDQHKDIIEVVARVSTEWNADKAFAGLTNAIQANPDINFLVTSSDFMHPQIQQVLEVAGKWKKRGGV